MDQASLLREMMKKTERVEKIPFAIIATSVIVKEEQITKSLIEKIEKQNGNKITIIRNLNNEEQTFVETENKTYINIEKIIKEEKEVKKEIIRLIENKEKKSSQIVIEAGRGIDYATVNSTLLVDEVLMIMDLSEKSIEELKKYMKIAKALGKKQRISILIENEQDEDIENKLNKLQENVWDEFNYYIELIGIFEKTKLEMIASENLNLDKYKKENAGNEKISISLKNRFF